MDFFEFTKSDYEYIVKECMLNKEYAKLLELRIKGYSRLQIAEITHNDIKTIDRMIAKLKKKIRKIL